jgi:hypothetical protein
MGRFAKPTCPVCARRFSRIFSNLRCSHFHWMASFAGYSAPRVHQDTEAGRSKSLVDTDETVRRHLYNEALALSKLRRLWGISSVSQQEPHTAAIING